MHRRKHFRFSLSGMFFLAAAAVAEGADEPHFVNAKVETHAVARNLESSVSEFVASATQPAWIGYGVDAVEGNRSVCCSAGGNWNSSMGCGTCALEKGASGSNFTSDGNRTVKLEGSDQLIVMLRTEDHRVMRIRIASEDCTLDAGGLRVVWLTGVKPQESIALLSKDVEEKGFEDRHNRGVGEEALTALALHADSAADRALASFVDPRQPEELRKRALFWLGAGRGKTGLALLQKMAKEDPSPQVREQVSFALSVSKEPDAVETMIQMARDDSDAHVRSQALFWLGQKAGRKAQTAITGAIQNDPDTEVKKKAVFALSQMPKEEGIPKLIEVAQTNRNPEVRKQAMFWLGQSGDPRALAFFEKVLSQ